MPFFQIMPLGLLSAGLMLLGLTATTQAASGANPIRAYRSLSGTWSFRQDKAGAEDWKDVVIPSSFQSHEGTNFHGVGWYRRTVGRLDVPEGKRLLLQF